MPADRRVLARRAAFPLLGASLFVVGLVIWLRPSGEARADYDPLALAAARGKLVKNLEAGVPAQCYTKTEGKHNPCWTCHVPRHDLNAMGDDDLQEEYAFSDVGKQNQWSNLFVDRSASMAKISDDEILSYVREDNYEPLRKALKQRSNYRGYVPDLDFAQGFDAQGFARDGSHWRAFRYKPFPGAFWPTNGSTDDVLIRLPKAFRERGGRYSREVYQLNLALLEAQFSSDPKVPLAQVRWPTEALDESIAGRDLDGDGSLKPGSKQLQGLPKFYFGDASSIEVVRTIFPQETEFLHSVRYLDPDRPGAMAQRMKELRYSRKKWQIHESQIRRAYEAEADEKDEGRFPFYGGNPESGLKNEFGWVIQGYIEDAQGRLRLQTHEEHRACMGCHSSVGVTLDQTFAFARKLPAAAGWQYQSIEGIPDVPQLGHTEPEILTYLERTGGGDEFRGNDEILGRFFPGGSLDVRQVRRAAPGGDRDIAFLIVPSRERALALDKAYRTLVIEQKFEFGRDVTLAPAKNVHRKVTEESTGLLERGKVYADGQLRLDWSQAKLAEPELAASSPNR